MENEDTYLTGWAGDVSKFWNDMNNEFIWTDALVKEMLYSKLPLPDHYMCNVQKCLDEFKASKEQLKPKEYEIIIFKDLNDTSTPFRSRSDPYWKNSEFGGGKSESEMLNSSRYEIHSVRRLSDNKIFSVGDFANNGKITGINIGRDGVLYFSWKKDGETDHDVTIDRLDKAKQPLFTTEDGKEIFEGDVYWVDKEGFTQGSALALDISKNYKYYSDQYLYFSTETAAKEYVQMNKPIPGVYNKNWWDEDKLKEIKLLMNRPCLSVNDVLSISDCTFDFCRIHAKRLQELAKNKIV